MVDIDSALRYRAADNATKKSSQSAGTPGTSVMPGSSFLGQYTAGNFNPNLVRPSSTSVYLNTSGINWAAGQQMPARPSNIPGSVLPDPNPFSAGSSGDRLPGGATGSLAALQQAIPDASQALSQLGGAEAMSSIPAGPGGGNTGFAQGDNCGRPNTDGTTPGVGEGASPGQKEFVPPESLKNDPEFQAKLAEMKAKYPGLTDQQIYNVIGGESGFNFKAVNGSSGATGAFQFIPSTAQSLGYSTADIQNMSPAQQLGVYDKYLSSNGYKGGPLGIMQAAPGYAGKPGNTVVYAQGSKAWAQNPGWRGADGQITVDSINRYYGY